MPCKNCLALLRFHAFPSYVMLFLIVVVIFGSRDGKCSRWRHFRVRLRLSIPSFLPFGKRLIHIPYNGQTRTCRHCHLPSHLANSCRKQCCYNCDESGHLSSACPQPVVCNICKATDHKEMPFPFPGRNCYYSTDKIFWTKT